MTKHCLLVKGGGAQIHHKGKSLPGNIIGVQKAAWFLLLSSLVMISLPGLFLIQWSSPVRVGPGGYIMSLLLEAACYEDVISFF